MIETRIRRYRRADAEALWELFQETVHTINGRDYTPEQLDAWAPASRAPAHWAASFAHSTTFVATQGDGIVGFAEIERSGRIGRVYASARHQRQGIGSMLLQRLEAEAVARGAAALAVDVSVTALPFFVRHGYTTVRRQEVVRRGVVLVNYAMTKNLAVEPDTMRR